MHIKKAGIKTGFIYFFIHFMVEIICFFYLSKVTNNSIYIWIVPFAYDAMAFVPQGLIGYLSDKYPKINIGLIGVLFFIISYIIFCFTNISVYISLILLCLGNAFLHVAGAEDTLRTSNGKLSPSAIYVAGGSFGVISGRLLAKTSFNPAYMFIVILLIIPLVLLSKKYITKDSNTDNFNYVKEEINTGLVIVIAVLVVTIRGYMGYGIPISWNKTVIQTIILFSIMGLGKALGGILSDIFGIKKIAIISCLASIPFLCFGDNNMFISLIGVMFFSMTMSITLAILVSKLKNIPGVAFGLTTIGLFLGTIPVFFIRISMIQNIILIIVASILCALALSYVLKDDKK